MDWFSAWVDRCVKAWGKRSSAKLAEIAEQLGFGTATNTEVGHAGEQHVAAILAREGYEAQITAGSRTPADVCISSPDPVVTSPAT